MARGLAITQTTAAIRVQPVAASLVVVTHGIVAIAMQPITWLPTQHAVNLVRTVAPDGSIAFTRTDGSSRKRLAIIPLPSFLLLIHFYKQAHNHTNLPMTRTVKRTTSLHRQQLWRC